MTARVLFAALLTLGLTGCGGGADTADGPEVASSRLDTGDETLQSGEYMESFTLAAREGQWIRAEVVSTDFDPYLMVVSPTGDQTDVDDSEAGNRSATKAILQATESGAWTIIVTTYEPGEDGDFELSYQAVDTRPDDADEGQQVTPEEQQEEGIDV